MDSFHVTFIKHLNDQPCVLHPSVDTTAEPDAMEGVTAPTPASQQLDECPALLELEGVAEPSGTSEESKLPRCSA